MPPTTDNVNINIKALVQGLADVRALVNEIQKLPGAGAGIAGLNKDIGQIQNRIRGAATEIRSLGSDAYAAVAKVQTASGGAARGMGQVGVATRATKENVAELSQGAAAVGRAFQDALQGNVLGALQSVGVALRTSLNFSLLTAEGVPAFQKIGKEVIETDRLLTRFSSTLGTAAKNVKGSLSTTLLNDFGVNAAKSLALPEVALQKFISQLSLIPDANDRATAAANVFGASTARLLPTIEALVAAEQAAALVASEYAAAQAALVAAQARTAASSVAVTNAERALATARQASVVSTVEVAAAESVLSLAHVEATAAKLAETAATEALTVSQAALATATTAVAEAEVVATAATITLGTALTAVTLGIGAILAVAAGVIIAGVAIGKSFSDAGSELNDLSQKTGLLVEDLSALKLAADQSGSSLDSATGSFTKYLKNVNEAANSNKALAGTFKDLGIDVKTANEDSTDALQQLFEALQKIPPGAQQINAAMKLAGKSGADLIPIVRQVGGDFEAFKQKATDLGVVLSGDAAAAADDFGDKLTELGAVAGGLRNQIGVALLPTLIELASSLEQFVLDNKQGFSDLGSVIATTFKIALGVMYAFGGVVGLLTNIVYALITAVIGLIVYIYQVSAAAIKAGAALQQFISGNIPAALAIMRGAVNDTRLAINGLVDDMNRAATIISQPTFSSLFKLFNSDSTIPKAAPPPKPTGSFNRGGGGGKGGGGGGGDAKALADALIAIEKARLDAMTDLLRDSIKTEQEILQEKFSQNLISYKQYYAELNELQLRDNAAQIDRQRKLIEIEERQLAKTRKGSDRARSEAELVKLNADLQILLRNNENITRRTTVEVQKQARAYADMIADINEQLAEFEGGQNEALNAKVDRDFRDKLEKAQSLATTTGDDTDVKKIERLKEILKAQGQAKLLEKEINDIIHDREQAEEAVNIQVQQGLITREQANAQLKAFEQAQAAQIGDLVAGMDAYAQKVNSPELKQAVITIKQELAKWGVGQVTRDVDALKEQLKVAQDELAVTIQNINTAETNGAYNEQEAYKARSEAIDAYGSKAYDLLTTLEKIAIATKNADLQNFVDRARADLGELKADGDDLAVSLNKSFIGAFSDLFTSIAEGTKSAKQAFADFGRAILQILTQLLIKIIITKIAMAALGGATGGSGGLGGILSGLFGGDSAIGGNARGGLIEGVGTGTSDSNLRRLSKGEFVVNAAATRANYDILQDINNGLNPKRNTNAGSSVVPATAMANSMASNLKVVNVLPNDLLDNYITSGDGSRAMLNFIGDNANAINTQLKQ